MNGQILTRDIVMRLTNDKRKVLKFTGVPLVFYGRKAFCQKILRILRVIFIYNDLMYDKSSSIDGNKRPTKFMDSEISRQDIPMLIAVSCRSPVRTHTLQRLISASRQLQAPRFYLDPGHL